MELGVKVIHIAERDTQTTSVPKRVDEFVNTWSVEGFAGEGTQPAELGWGSHERHFPSRRQAPRVRLRCRHLSAAAGRIRARALLDAAGRPISRLSDHSRRIHFHRRLPHGSRGRPDIVSSDRALRLPPLRCGGAVGARACGQELAHAGEQARADGRYLRRNRRARRAVDGAREMRLLAGLPGTRRRRAQARSLQQCDQPASVRRCVGLDGVGDREPVELT